MPAARLPFPSSSKALHGISRTAQSMPATPVPLFPTAPMIPATCVPWNSASIGSASPPAGSIPKQSSTKPLPSSSTPLALQSASLRKTLAARSSWV